jgi:hypothetical protein
VRLLTHLYEVVCHMEEGKYTPALPSENMGKRASLGTQEAAVWARLLQLDAAPLHLGSGRDGDVVVQAVDLCNDEMGLRGARALAWYNTCGACSYLQFFPNDNWHGASPPAAVEFLRSIGLTKYELGSLAPVPGGDPALLRIPQNRIGEALGLSQEHARLLRRRACWEGTPALLGALAKCIKDRGSLADDADAQGRVHDWATLLHLCLPSPTAQWLSLL